MRARQTSPAPAFSSAVRVGFAIPGPIETAVSGGYIYDRALISEMPALGVELAPIELPSGFPFPGGFPELDLTSFSDVQTRLDQFNGPLLVDGLAFGAFPEALAARVGPRAVALVHHPLAYETGLAPERAAYLKATEQAALAHATAVVATSETTAQTLIDDFAVPRGKITVAPPGFSRRPRAPLLGEPPVVLAVGAAIRRKRFPELIDALCALADLDWRFRLIGPRGVDAAETARLDASLRRAQESGIRDRLTVEGAVEAATLAEAYARADLFVSAAAYEGYGMAIAEAALAGLPIVAVAGGAARETAAAGSQIDPALEEAVLVEALAASMRPLLSDRGARQDAGARVWAARDLILTPQETAERVATALRGAFGVE